MGFTELKGEVGDIFNLSIFCSTHTYVSLLFILTHNKYVRMIWAVIFNTKYIATPRAEAGRNWYREQS